MDVHEHELLHESQFDNGLINSGAFNLLLVKMLAKSSYNVKDAYDER